ncbi:hypothetical protein BO85DRAFT_229089 [Aspergillus piperis CBS 112811]|uniref:Uncharacterized protein n=1 Tax=Aspergillus piperis CBS 112811 TaxID=1448313 RepID=A0A8G1R958_9EURO|nr:hypothetical protein BO85DRAFT_229089 [Aspergillus piperis CBS 112811]RAH60509.1 hypothetical protein BO85DRAFT_229089 [Aspergillus piperis CBS 112811]
MCGRVCVRFCYSSTLHDRHRFNVLFVHVLLFSSIKSIYSRIELLHPCGFHLVRLFCLHTLTVAVLSITSAPEPRLLPPCCEWLTGLHDLDKSCSSHTRMHNGRHFRGSSPRHYIHGGMSVSFCMRKYGGIETSVARLGFVRTYLLRDCR